MSTQEIVSIIIAIIILLTGVAILYRNYKKNKFSKQQVESFLSSIEYSVKTRIIELIEQIDFDDFNSLSEAEAEFIDHIYDDIWNFTWEQLDILYENQERNTIYRIIKVALHKDKIRDYVDILFGTEQIQNKFIEIYNKAIENKEKNIVNEDERLANEADKYERGLIDSSESVEELDPTHIPGVEEQNLNPPIDEELETVDVNDNSVEILSSGDDQSPSK